MSEHSADDARIPIRHLDRGVEEFRIERAGPAFPEKHVRLVLPPTVRERGWVVLPADALIAGTRAVTTWPPRPEGGEFA